MIEFNANANLLSNHDLFEEVNKWFAELIDILEPYE